MSVPVFRPVGEVEDAVSALLPDLKSALNRLVSIPSIALDGYPTEPLMRAHDAVVELLRDSGITQIEELTIPGKTAPVVMATVPGPPGSPTVLF